MILFLFGLDTYRSRKKLEEIVARYKAIHKSGLSFYVFDEERRDFQEFKNAVGSSSMLGEKKLVVANCLLGFKEFSDALFAWQGKDDIAKSKDCVVVFFEQEVDKKNPSTLWVLKNSESQEFKILTGYKLQKWCERYLLENDISIEKLGLLRLIARTGGDLWAFENEVKKCKAYVRSKESLKERAEITYQDLNVFFRAPLETNIFGFIDAFAEGNKAQALKFLHGHFAAGDDPHYLFSMLYHQIRNIAVVSDLWENGEKDIRNIARILGLHPFVVKKSLSQKKMFDRGQIKQLYKLLVELEKDLKIGVGEPRAALQRLIFARSRIFQPLAGPLAAGAR